MPTERHANNSHLTSKIVAPQNQDLRQSEIRGERTSKLFVEVTKELRGELDDQVSQINDEFQSAFAAVPGIPGVARITLRPKALAKSHRPIELLQKSSCPVIGTGGFGDCLFVFSSDGRTVNHFDTFLRRVANPHIAIKTKIVTAATTLGSMVI